MEALEDPIQPYAYSRSPHPRRHGPTGYADYREYRPWLDDEFSFRCVYCLKRMVWVRTDTWVVDHLIPQNEAPHRVCDYDNLVLACQFCNGQKGSNHVPDPCEVAYGDHLQVESNGEVTALDNFGQRLITVLRLDHPFHIQFRKTILDILAILASYDRPKYERLMGYPSDLPDLAAKKPPQGNRRPEGIAQSCHAKRQRGELPAVY